MRKNIVLDVKGIKCDDPGCDYIDNESEIGDYKDWINVPCPKCGASLLTEEDYQAVKILVSLTEAANKLEIPAKDKEDLYQLEVKMNGSGTINFGELKKKEGTHEE